MYKKIIYAIKIVFSPRRLIIFLCQNKIIKLDEKTQLKIMYRNYFRRKINFENPQTFNEKLQWLKLYDHKKIYTTMVDKYAAKEYVANIIGKDYIIPTLGIYDKFENIDFAKLPNQFVIKCTHDSGGVVICRNKDEFDYALAKKKINKYLKRNYYYMWLEWPYKDVVPRIMIEPYLIDHKLNELRDYKFFVFNNKHVMSFVCSNRSERVKFTFFDENGKFLDIRQCNCDNDPRVKLPINYKKMIKLAEKLSVNTICNRVDFYEVDGKIYFGELTLYDTSGFGNFTPDEYDYILGAKLKLPIDGGK